MSGELETQVVLSQAESILLSEEDKNYEVEISSKVAVSLVNWLDVSKTLMFCSREIPVTPNEESIVWSLRQRLVERIPPGSMSKIVPVNIEMNYREVDFLGGLMRRKGIFSSRFFLQLNDAFVEAGGKDNTELRRAFEMFITGNVVSHYEDNR